MSTRIIQVPMDSQLLERLTRQRGDRFRSRAELIRVACEHYLTLLERSNADARYRAGYRKKPEDLRLTKAAAKLAGAILSKESWK